MSQITLQDTDSYILVKDLKSEEVNIVGRNVDANDRHLAIIMIMDDIYKTIKKMPRVPDPELSIRRLGEWCAHTALALNGVEQPPLKWDVDPEWIEY